MNSIIQAFFNQLILFVLSAALHICCYYQGRVENLNPLNTKQDLFLFIVIWFGLGTYFTWKFSYGIFAS